MKNKERYSKKLLDSLYPNDIWFGLEKGTENIKNCTDIMSCTNCIFFDPNKSCEIKRAKWLNAEYEDESKVAEEKFKAYCNSHNCSGCKYKNKIDCTVAYMFDHYEIKERKENNHEE